MKQNPTLSIKILASELGVSDRTVERDRQELHREGFICGRTPHLFASNSKVHVRRERRMRQVLKLLKADPEATRGEMARSIGTTSTTVSEYVIRLIERGDLPEDFIITSSADKPRHTQPTLRERRRPRLLAGIAKDHTMNEIARNLRVHKTSIIKDIEAMRLGDDPGLLEAEKERDALRARTPPSAHELAMNQALKEIGCTAEDLEREHVEWMDSADPDTPLTRKTIA